LLRLPVRHGRVPSGGGFPERFVRVKEKGILPVSHFCSQAAVLPQLFATGNMLAPKRKRMTAEKTCPAYLLVERQEKLSETVSELAKKQVLACDVEVDTLFHYGETLCLLQFSDGEKTWLVEPLAVKDLSVLAAVLEDQRVEKIIHGADFDVRMMSKHLGITCRRVFDTEIAARYLSQGSSLAALIKKYFGISLAKKYQKANWRQRPLPAEMLAYAASDVYWLPRLADVLKQELRKLKRLEWVEEECAFIGQKTSPEKSSHLLFLRFAGAGTLPRRKLALLEAILQWREGLARKRDCPPFKILDNETVRRMVNQPPLTEAELLRIRMFSRKTPEFRQSLLQAVRTGLSCPEEKLPVYPKFFRVPGWPGEKEKEERERMLKSWRQAKSMSLGLAPGLLLTTKQLRELAEKAPLRLPDLNKVEGLRNWQKRVFGEELCYLLRRSAGKEK